MAQTGSGAVEEDPLVDLRYPELSANLARAPTFDFSEDEHLPLTARQERECRGAAGLYFTRQEPFIGSGEGSEVRGPGE